MTPPRKGPPPVFPLGRPAKGGWFRRMPPAVFPGILGLLWLGLAWRKAAAVFDLPLGLVDASLGAVTLLWAFSVCAYAAKALRRPAVVAEDLRILPGRDGMAALALSFSAVALVLMPTRPGLSAALLLSGVALHFALIALAAKGLVASLAPASGPLSQLQPVDTSRAPGGSVRMEIPQPQASIVPSRATQAPPFRGGHIRNIA